MSNADLFDVGELKRLDTRLIVAKDDAIFCFACVRDEALRLPYFLDYHRARGVGRFFIIDNASSDGTTAFLLDQPDVHVFSADGSYAASLCGVDWLNALLERFAPGHWALTLDADELFVYPDCERLSLGDFTRGLEHQGAEAVAGFLLDMYGEGSVRTTEYVPGTSFIATCPYFDADSYIEHNIQGLPVRGGPRHRMFWEGYGRGNPAPVLDKIPLVNWRSGLRYQASTHRIHGVSLSEETCVLLHFKLFSDFTANVSREAARLEHWDGAAQYSTYHDVVRDQPELSAFYSGSLRYENSSQLISLGLMRDLATARMRRTS